MPNPGALRFNTDSQKLELYDGNQWTEIVASSPDSQTGGARGVILAGQTPLNRTDNQYITISSTGNSIDFGTLSTIDGGGNAPFSDRTRGIFSGASGYATTGIQFITISSTGSSTTFGSLTTASGYAMGAANSTRGIRAGNYPTNTNVIDYVTIQSTGNAQDFGDLLVGRSHGASNQSSTRGVFSGGYNSSSNTNTIDFINF